MKKSFVIILVSIITWLHSWAQTILFSNEVSFHEVKSSTYRNIENPATLSKLSMVYSEADTLSNKIDSLAFNTTVEVIAEGEFSSEKQDTILKNDGSKYENKKYYSLKWYHINFNNKKGYIKSDDLALHTFLSDNGSYKYFFSPHSGIIIYKYNLNTNKLVSKFKLKSIRADLVEKINISGWKNTQSIFRVTQVDAFCGGGVYDTYIIDANGSMKSFFKTNVYNSEDPDEAYASTIWIPINNKSGKLILAQKGSSNNNVASFSDEPYTLNFPTNLIYNKNELLVVKITEKESGKNKITSHYYKWNGEQLILLKNEKKIK